MESITWGLDICHMGYGSYFKSLDQKQRLVYSIREINKLPAVSKLQLT
jgi:hypothetical protein